MGYKILLADDSVTVQKIITLTFSDEGVDVLTVNNGDEAISRLQYMRPALVMADVSIPGKNGYEICEFVKSHPEMKNTPVILLVPAFEPFDEARARKIGADHFLTKPFQSIRTLISTVKSLIEPSNRVSPSILESSLGSPNGEHQSAQTVAERSAAAVNPVAVRLDSGDLSELDNILDLDDVMAELWQAPGAKASPAETAPVEAEPVAAVEAAEEIEAVEIAKAESFSLSGSVVDEIVNRVVAEVTEKITERLDREFAPRIAQEVARIVKEQQLAEKPVYREPEPLLELDEV